MSSGHQRIKWRRNIVENFNRLSTVHERYRQTTDRRTDGRRHIANMNMSSRSLKSTRNSSGDEIANVNFLYDDIVHVLQNTILVHKFRHRSTRLCVGTHVLTKFSEITQYNGHYVVQGHSRTPILVPIESSYTTSY